MFITRDDLNKKLYEEIIDAITRCDERHEERAMATAIEMVRSYLAGRYDLDFVFEKRGNERNLLVVKCCCDIALYELADVLEMMPITILNPYENTMMFLEKLQKGEATLVGVPEPIDPTTSLPDSYIKHGEITSNRY